MSRQGWSARIQLYGGIALGVGLFGWFLSSIDFGDLVAVLGEVQWRWVALAALSMIVYYALHGWRWKILLHHVDPDLDWRTWWRATTVMWAFNTLLPLRAGNLLRPAVVSLERNVPYTTLLFTMVAETVCDVFILVLLVFATLRLLPDALLQQGPMVELKGYGSWGAVGALVSLVGIVLLSTRRARTVVEALLAPIPSSRVRERILLVFDQLVEGMAAVGDPLRFIGALGATALVWGAWFVGIASTLRAFSLDVPVAGALFIEAALSLAMLLPQAPGFLGMFQVVVENALSLFGAPTTEAKAVALVFWVVCFIPITVLGLWDASRLGIGIRSSSRSQTFEDLADRAEER